MRAKTKTFFEDLMLLIVVGVIIYAIYSYFFSSNEKQEVVPQANVEKAVENSTKEVAEVKKEEEITAETQKTQEETTPVEPLKEDAIKVEENLRKSSNMIIRPDKVEDTTAIVEKADQTEKSENVETTTKTENITKPEKTTKENTKSVSVQKPVEEKSAVQDSEEKIRVEAFYQPIREKISENINKNLDKSSIKSGEHVNIRLTVLKDGRYEQLTFVDGNKEYFELVKPSITKVFPIKIEESVKNSFPRYFRMKIEF